MKLSKKEIETIFSKQFPFLSKKDLDCFLEITNYKKKKKKEVIIGTENRSDKLFFILKGYVRGFTIDPCGTEQNILLREEGYFVGDADKLFYNAPQKYTYVAITKTHYLSLKYSDFEKLALNNPAISKLLLHVLKEIISTQGKRIESLISTKAKIRYQILAEIKPEFIKKVSSKHIASFLGITPVSLSRITNSISSKNK